MSPSLEERPSEERSAGQPATAVGLKRTSRGRTAAGWGDPSGGLVPEAGMRCTACIGGEDAARGGPPAFCGGVRLASLLRGKVHRASRERRRRWTGPLRTSRYGPPSSDPARARRGGMTPRGEMATRAEDLSSGGVASMHGAGRSMSRGGTERCFWRDVPGGKPRRATGVGRRQRRQSQRTRAAKKALKLSGARQESGRSP